MLLLLLLLTKQRYLYHACECVLEHMCILHLLFYNLLYCWKIVCPPPQVSTVNLEPYHHVPARALTH